MVLKPNPVFVPKVVGSWSPIGLAAFAIPVSAYAMFSSSCMLLCRQDTQHQGEQSAP